MRLTTPSASRSGRSTPSRDVVADPCHQRLVVRSQLCAEQLGELRVGVAHDGGQAPGTEDVVHLPPRLLESGTDLVAHGALRGSSGTPIAFARTVVSSSARLA